VALTPVDRELLIQCLQQKPGAWNDFVDRFLGLIIHVVTSAAHLRSVRLTPEDQEDIVAEVLMQFLTQDCKALRNFQGNSSLAAYITVIARRTAIHELTRRQAVKDEIRRGQPVIEPETPDDAAAQKSIESLEQVERLLRKLRGKDREVVRLFYLEGRSYEEISTELDIPMNTLSSMLSRARKKLREMTPNPSSTMEVQSLASLVKEETRRKKSPGT